MAGKRDKRVIRLDYAALGDDSARDSEIPRELVKKAKRLLGRGEARQEILRMMDQTLRVQAAEVARRQMDPLRLYEVGQQAVLEAIKSYQIKQQEDFREFATAFVRQSMVLAKNKAIPGPTPPQQEPPRPE